MTSSSKPSSSEARYGGEGGTVIQTNVDQTLNWLLNWGRAHSVWYLLFGLACCAIELMQTGGPRSDFERFGAAPRSSPRSSDLMIVAGTLTYKMALRVRRLFDQMALARLNWIDLHGTWDISVTDAPNLYAYFIQSEKFPKVGVAPEIKAANLR